MDVCDYFFTPLLFSTDEPGVGEYMSFPRKTHTHTHTYFFQQLNQISEQFHQLSAEIHSYHLLVFEFCVTMWVKNKKQSAILTVLCWILSCTLQRKQCRPCCYSCFGLKRADNSLVLSNIYQTLNREALMWKQSYFCSGLSKLCQWQQDTPRSSSTSYYYSFLWSLFIPWRTHKGNVRLKRQTPVTKIC